MVCFRYTIVNSLHKGDKYNNNNNNNIVLTIIADPSGRAIKGVGLRPLAC